MTTPFQASKLFQNSSNEGWDDWDWVDNSVPNSNVKDANQNIHNSIATSVPYSPYLHPAEINATYSNTLNNANIPVVTNNNGGIATEQSDPYFSQPNQNPIENFNNGPFMNVNASQPLFQSHNQIEQLPTMNVTSGLQDQNFGINVQQTDDPYNNDLTANVQQPNLFQPPVQTPFYPNVPQQNFENPPLIPINSHVNDTNVVQPVASITPNPAHSISPPPLDKSPYANTNPFKRVNMHSYKPPPGISSQQTIPNLNLMPPVNQRSVTVGNSDGFQANLQPSFDNAEPPQNERNQYLQTGHLSDEGIDLIASSQNTENNSFNQLDSLPPPGLSRLVLGEPEAPSASQINHLPPSSNRMVPGDEVGSEINLNLERQADGQDVSEVPVQNRNSTQFTAPAPHSNQQHQIENPTSGNISDRNLYLVAGESNSEVPNIQRVVTGLDNRNIETPVTEPRELMMDGENLNDNRDLSFLQLPPPPPVSIREEPIEGANTSDDLVNPTSVNTHHLQADTVENHASHPSNSKYNSNPSTGNEESDREKRYHKKGGEDRRSEERSKKKGRQYETEDTDHSTRDSRRYRENRNKPEKNDRPQREKESSKNRDKYSQRSHKDRPSNRDRYYDDKDDSNYDRKRSDKHRDADKYSRYETDGSRYDTEDPKYERGNRRNNDREQGRHRDGRSDRQYRRNRDVDDRERDERYGRRDYRYPEYDSGEYGADSRGRRRENNGSEQGDPYLSQYYNQQPYGYNPYSSYYQQQQYYENLRRTNPHAYAEWYKHYFGNQMQLAAEDRGRESGRESVHSGRSSSKDNDSKSKNATQASLEPERLTPLKFTSKHCWASFENGVLVCLKQKYLPNDFGTDINIFNFAENNATKRLYQAFPGPLSSSTHTKQIIDFCLERSRHGPADNALSRSESISSLQSISSSSKASYSLLWNFLILLLRQRGAFVGSDISELLLQNKHEFPYVHESLETKSLSKQKMKSSSADIVEDQRDENEAVENESPSLSELEVTEKFRNYLLYGSINEALEWATENNLWGHALFLASKMDRRTHANVMIKFANQITLTDPLQTLYQLKSGRTPLSVTCVQDEKWGDWRPHLAMIISNSCQKTEFDRKTILTLGDTLYNRGDLFAAHFCYLLAKSDFGRYSDINRDSQTILHASNAVRLILLGASPNKSFSEFATDEAIIMTEIYEYACSLTDPNFSIIEFQPYKFLLGTRMLDYGFHLKSLLYMEQVAEHIQKNPSSYNRSFVEKVSSLADKLKYYDPVLEKHLDNLGDEDSQQALMNSPQQWQNNLQHLLYQLPVNNNAELNYENVNTDNNVNPGYSYTSQIDQEFVQINQQISDLNLQYENNVYAQQPDSLAVQPNEMYYDPTKNQIPYTNDHQYERPSEDVSAPGNYYGSYQSMNDNLTNFNIAEESRPTISMPNSISKKPGFYDDEPLSTNVDNNKNISQSKSKDNNVPKKAPLNAGSDSSSKGWSLGGIFNKLSLKPKNQMILPDDKNPAIVWDSEMKRWINTDQDSAEEEVFKPPPKMNEMSMPISNSNIDNFSKSPSIPMGNPEPMENKTFNNPNPNPNLSQSVNPQPTVDQPVTNAEPKPPSLHSNMFKMQRNKSLKKSYVDVFNPGGAPSKPTENIFAPSVPTMPASTGFFIPGAPQSNEQSNVSSTYASDQQEPVFYNPNQFSGYQQ